MKRICECGHSETDHADIGYRRCAKQGCQCGQYMEHDEPDPDRRAWDDIKWVGHNDRVLSWFPLVLAALALAFSIAGFVGCPHDMEDSSPAVARVYDADSLSRADSVEYTAGICPKGCTCWSNGFIESCPDYLPSEIAESVE